MSDLPPIDELVPHSRPMILLDEVVAHEPDRVRCRLWLRPDSLFVSEGRVRAVIALEYMAQAVAAYAGLRARAAGVPVRIGFLLGTRELRLEIDHFDVGDELLVEAVHVWGDEQLGSFLCTVLRGAVAVATATLNVYLAREGPRA
ncbi:MAG: hypothetical protein A2V77_18990 [Anaeromyxobacter sp. RBG_16_69_14]|nr:MAG: hypothetical protein A2V77_18990 [Anaeromyxobacter sp. RBG_16_69_14]